MRQPGTSASAAGGATHQYARAVVLTASRICVGNGTAWPRSGKSWRIADDDRDRRRRARTLACTNTIVEAETTRPVRCARLHDSASRRSVPRALALSPPRPLFRSREHVLVGSHERVSHRGHSAHAVDEIVTIVQTRRGRQLSRMSARCLGACRLEQRRALLVNASPPRSHAPPWRYCSVRLRSCGLPRERIEHAVQAPTPARARPLHHSATSGRAAPRTVVKPHGPDYALPRTRRISSRS